jgi:hypothetical protein
MTFILLTGAGFSYNWGGLLASEVFNALLAGNDIDAPTRDRLFDAGFEQVLADLQLSTPRTRNGMTLSSPRWSGFSMA